MRDSIPWQEGWTTKEQHGARAKHSTVNALARISMVLERAILEDKPMSKAFVNIPIEVTFSVCSAAGMDNRLHQGLKGMCERMKRQFNIGGYFGCEFQDTNGLLQGCPLSVMLLNIWMSVLSKMLNPVVHNGSFVDDLTVLSGSVVQLQEASNLMHSFMNDTGQKVNLKKIRACGPKGGADVSYDDQPMPHRAQVEVPGVILEFGNGR